MVAPAINDRIASDQNCRHRSQWSRRSPDQHGAGCEDRLVNLGHLVVSLREDAGQPVLRLGLLASGVRTTDHGDDKIVSMLLLPASNLRHQGARDRNQDR